jgi:small subunit ribosomal protein SAe
VHVLGVMWRIGSSICFHISWSEVVPPCLVVYGSCDWVRTVECEGVQGHAGSYAPLLMNEYDTAVCGLSFVLGAKFRILMQPIMEAALGNIPVIAFCDTDSPMSHVDIGIPANNKGKHSIGALFWLLARMVLQMRGTITPAQPWDVMVQICGD